MKQVITAVTIASAVLASAPAMARGINVEITNLTSGIYFTPLLVVAHDRSTHLFQPGTEASLELQAMAEGGDLTGLIEAVEDAGGKYTVVSDPDIGVLAPGDTESATLSLHRRHRARLSLVGMLLPTNDGFVGLDALKIPKLRGTYTYYLNGYDAGTEANDEIVNGGGAPGTPGIPADPGGHNGTGALALTPTPAENTLIHVHRGNAGDDDPSGGSSDLDSRVHRWLNPVARVIVQVD